jgi:RND family efflux transporter MFP subunit
MMRTRIDPIFSMTGELGWPVAWTSSEPLTGNPHSSGWVPGNDGKAVHGVFEEKLAAIAQQLRDIVPSVRVSEVKPSGPTVEVSLPATTFAFEAANIFARTNGYILKRNVDIGDHVKAGDVLAELTAPELDHQIAQAQATLAQTQATLQQNVASKELAQVTNDRVGTLVKQGWATTQLGDTDRLSLEAQDAAVGVAQANIKAQESLIKVLEQKKDYQRVVAPFDGVITQRAVDVGSLVQAGSTFMFTLMHSHIIRVQVFVPQDQAFGLAPGIKAVVRVRRCPTGRSRAR